METTTFSDDLRRYAGLLWHWAWLLAVTTIAAALAAYFISSQVTPVYMATTKLLINEAPATKSTDYASLLTSERLARTYSELLTTQPVLQAVIDRLVLDESVGDIQKRVQVELVRDTQIINVSVEDIDPGRAAAIANAIVSIFAEQNRALQTSRYATSKESLAAQMADVDLQIQNVSDSLALLGDGPANKTERDRLEAVLAQYRQTYASILQSYEQVRVSEASTTSNVVQVEDAIAPDLPIRPRVLTNTLLSALVGMIVGVGMAFLMEALDDTLGPGDVSRQLGLPVLGVIARHSPEAGNPVVAAEPRAPVAEAFRSLRTNIQFASVDHTLRTLLVTSPSPEDGKSTVAANLAVSMAQSGRKVLLLDADLRRPQVHRKFGLANRVGMSTVFVQRGSALDGAVQATQVPNLAVLSSGSLPPNPSELLGSERMKEIMQAVASSYDMLIIDSPPVMAVTDAAVLAPRVDGVLLVVKPGTTKLAACRQAVEQLHRVGAEVLGVVLNDIDLNRVRYKYAYYKGYYYTYHHYYSSDGDTVTAKPRS